MIPLFPPNDDMVAFLRACKTTPDDDAPRLIFADYLEENGHVERATFIRLQCELARQPTYTSAAQSLNLQVETLFDAHVNDWMAPWRHVLRHKHRRFTRGLLDLSLHASAFADTFRQKGHGPVHYPWVESLTLRDFDNGNFLGASAALAQIEGLCTLKTTNSYMADRMQFATAMQLVWHSRAMHNLRDLELESSQLLKGLLQAWVVSQPFHYLHTIRLRHTQFLDEETVSLLADPQVIPSLQHLHVDYCYATGPFRDAIKKRFGPNLHGDILDESEMIPF